LLTGGSAGCGIEGGATEIGGVSGSGVKAAMSVSSALSLQGGGLPVTLWYNRSMVSGCITVDAAAAPTSKPMTHASTHGQRRGWLKSCVI
jgi:hypothetical protein